MKFGRDYEIAKRTGFSNPELFAEIMREARERGLYEPGALQRLIKHHRRRADRQIGVPDAGQQKTA